MIQTPLSLAWGHEIPAYFRSCQDLELLQPLPPSDLISSSPTVPLPGSLVQQLGDPRAPPRDYEFSSEYPTGELDMIFNPFDERVEENGTECKETGRISYSSNFMVHIVFSGFQWYAYFNLLNVPNQRISGRYLEICNFAGKDRVFPSLWYTLPEQCVPGVCDIEVAETSS